MQLLGYLKPDIWLEISLYLPIRDILNLERTCKLLNDLMNERFVWDHAYRDILSIAPLARCRVGIDLPTMSSAALRKRVITAARLERSCCSELIVPRTIREFPYRSGVRTMQLIPGGQFVVLLGFKGLLHLHTIDSHVPICTENSLQHGGWGRSMRQRMSLAFDSEHNVLILVSIIMLNAGSTESHYTKLGMFRLNMQNPSFEKILIVDIPHNSVSDTCVLSASGNMWAAIPDLLAGSVHIRSTADPNHQGLVIDVNSELLGPELYRRVYFLSERSMLVFNPNAVAISDIPDPATKFSHGTTPIPTIPIWQQLLPSPCPSHRMYRNPISPIIWNSSTGRHEGPLVIYFGDHMQILDSGDRDYSSLDDSCIRKYEIKWKGLNHAWHLNATLSSRRAFWLGADGLQACTFPYDYRGHNGHMRLGSNPPYSSSARVVPVDLGNISLEDVCEASWDECSSRLCLLLQKGYSSEVITLDL